MLGTEDDATIDHDSAEVTNTHLHVITLAKMINVYFLFPAVPCTQDPCSIDPDPSLRPVCREFHVLYNLAHAVPTIWLRAWRPGSYCFFKQRALNGEKYLKKESF